MEPLLTHESFLLDHVTVIWWNWKFRHEFGHPIMFGRPKTEQLRIIPDKINRNKKDGSFGEVLDDFWMLSV